MPNATPEATRSYAQRFPRAHSDHWRLLGRTGLTASAYGFGCYRVHVDVPEHHVALRKALSGGVNLIDTSSNYGDGGSEELAGQMLKEMAATGEISREEIIVVTKVGYVQGQNLDVAYQRHRAQKPFPDMVHYMEGCWHCIHPEWLEDQLTRSLNRLQMPSVDVYLLHNPEYFLSDAAKKGDGGGLEKARSEYYRRIEAAFRWLESQVDAGRIGSYGISSNTFPNAAAETEFTSLEKCVAIAESIRPDHHFTTIQLPMNLIEHEAWTERNQRNDTMSVLQLAREKGLGVLINRPLNAYDGRKMVRLASHPAHDRVTLDARIAHALEKLLASEAALDTLVRNHAELQKADPKLLDYLRWGSVLRNDYRSLDGIEHWSSVQESHLWPSVAHAVQELGKLAGQSEWWKTWVGEYVPRLRAFLSAVTALYQERSQDRTAEALRAMDAINPGLSSLANLSQRALLALASLPEVSCVLVGMRRAEYVEDVLALNGQARLTDIHNFWNKAETLPLG